MLFRRLRIATGFIVAALLGSAGSNAEAARHVIASLQPRATYDVYRDGVWIQSGLVASRLGTLTFEADGEGSFEVRHTGAVDLVPPAAVTDLATVGVTQTTIALRWTAPGDDGGVGRATLYDLRYSTQPITAQNFAEATAVAGVPAPQPAGAPETLAITGLQSSTQYRFALKTRDDEQNWSSISNVPSGTTSEADPPPPPPPPDTTPPAPVGDLNAGEPTDSSFTLAWTATGDDGAVGTAAAYDLRYAAAPITDESWDAASPVAGEPAPHAAGTPEACAVSSLSPGTTYHFALRVRDDAGNLSALSNSATGSTLAPPPPLDETPPASVTDLAVDETRARGVTLTWTAPGDDGTTGVAGVYEARRAAGPITPLNWTQAIALDVPFEPRAASSAETLRVAGLAPDATWYFAVRAIDEAGNTGPVSNSPSTHTPAVADTLPPATILDLAAVDSTETSLTLRFTAPADSVPTDAEGSGVPSAYAVRFQLSGGAPFHWESATPADAPAVQLPGTAVTLVLDGLQPGVECGIVVRARDAAGNWSASASPLPVRTRVEVEPPPPPPPPSGDTLAPAAVTTLGAYAEAPDSALVSWRAVGDDDLAGRAARYQLRWHTASVTEENWAELDSVAGLPAPADAGAGESFAWGGREPGATYHFALRVYDEAGNASPLSNVAVLTMPFPSDEAPPSPPSEPRATWEDGAVVVRWDPSLDPDVAGYRLLRRRADRAELQVIAPLVVAGEWRDAAAIPGIVYAYSLLAVDRSGNLSVSTTEAVFLVPIAPGGTQLPLVRAVEMLAADPPDLRDPLVRLRWQVRENRAIAGYRVYRESVGLPEGAGGVVTARDRNAASRLARVSREKSGLSGSLELLTPEPLVGDGFLEFADPSVLAPGFYRYWIEALAVGDEPGQWLDPLLVRVDAGDESALLVAPNPTPGPVRVVYTRAAAGESRLVLFDASGRRRADFVRADGSGRQSWEITELPGGEGALSDGIYFFRLETEARVMRGRFVVLRRP